MPADNGGMTMNVKKLCLIGGIVLVLGYISGAVYYYERFFYNTEVYGIDISNMKMEAAKAVVQDKLSHYTLRIRAREHEDVWIHTSDINLRYDFGSAFEDLKSAQPMWNWPVGYLRRSRRDGDFPIVFDEKMLNDVLETFSFLQEENMRKPRDAYISEYQVDTGYKIIEQDYGTEFMPQAAVDKIKESLYGLQPSLDLESTGIYEQPLILSDNPALQRAAERMNALVSTTIYYAGNTTVDGSIISGWIRLDGNEVVVEDDRIREFVIALAEKYDTLGKPRTFMTSAVGEVEIPASKKIGWQVDREAEFHRIKEDLEVGQIVEREPVFVSRGIGFGKEEFGNTYVEIDLTNQHMYYYEEGQMILDSPIVTGNVSRGQRTPPGIFLLRAKMRNAVLRGRDYAAPVSYWMPFNGGIGLHDASWRGSFGGEIYRYGGSHGCVNMPRKNAKVLYENIEIGCPVICYNSNVRAKTNVAQFQEKQAEASAQEEGAQ